MANREYIIPANILPRYNDASQFSTLTIPQIRGLMHHFNIAWRDANGQLLPEFRHLNGNIYGRRDRYISAVINHFQQPLQPQNQPENPPNQPQNPPNPPNPPPNPPVNPAPIPNHNQNQPISISYIREWIESR